MKKILIVYGSAGGGHKSTAYAIKESLEAIYGDKVQVDTVDVLSKEYGPILTSTTPAIYKTLIKSPKTWELFYKLTDTTAGNKILDKTVSVISRTKAQDIVDEYAPLLGVCRATNTIYYGCYRYRNHDAHLVQ